MEYKLGNYKRIKEVGTTTPLECPKCKQNVRMQIFSNGEFRLKSELPLFRNGKVYFLVCPHCSALFGVDESKGKLFASGEELAIGNYDLKELQAFEK